MSLTQFLEKNPSELNTLSNEELIQSFETKINTRNTEELSGDSFDVKVPFSIGILCGIILFNFKKTKD